MKENNCYTYFSIVGYYDPKDVCNLLELEPNLCHFSEKKGINEQNLGYFMCRFCKCENYNVDVSKMMEETIKTLKEKIEVLKLIRDKYDVEYYIEVVPSIYVDKTNPCLAPSLEVIDFCHETRTQIDLDLYLYK